MDAWYTTALDILECLGSEEDDHVHNARNEDSSSVFYSILGPLQTFQRAELWRVVFSVQAFVLVFLGIYNLNVFDFVSKLLDGTEWF